MNDSDTNQYFYEFGDFRFSPRTKSLWRAEKLVPLTPKSLEILALLLENAPEIVTREEMIERIWIDTFVEEANINVAVSSLRKALEPSRPTRYILTVPKKGYRFIAEVRKVAPNEKNDDLISNRDKAPAERLQKTKFRWHLIVIIALGVFFVASFSLWLKYQDETGLSDVPVNARQIRSVAVLPLRDLGKSEQGRILSIGLTDNLISRLGRLNRFAVRPLSAVEKFSDGQTDSLEFGRQLKVDAVVVGTIQTGNNKLRLNIRLLDVRDGAMVWSQIFDETEDDIFELQDRLSLQIADNLVARLNKQDNEKLVRNETDDLRAFQAYSQARYHLSKRNNEDLQQAVRLFQKAIEIDPEYAAAYTGLADCYILLSDSMLNYFKPGENRERISEALRRSLEIDPGSAATYSTLGYFAFNFEWNVRKSLDNLEKAIALDPNLAQAHHWYAWILMADGRFSESETQMKFAHELDPTSPIIASEMGVPTLFAGKNEESLALFRKGVELDRNYFQTRFRLWYGLYFCGRFDEAEQELEAMKKISSADDPYYLVPRAMTYAKTGRTAEAKRMLNSLTERNAGGEYISQIWLASLAAELEQTDLALGFLNEAFAERSEYLLFVEHAPEYRNLRGDVRFIRLKQQVRTAREG